MSLDPSITLYDFIHFILFGSFRYFSRFSSSALVQAIRCGKHLAVALSTNVDHVTVCCLWVVQATAPKHQAFAVVAPSARHGSGRATPGGLIWWKHIDLPHRVATTAHRYHSIPKPQSHNVTQWGQRSQGRWPPCAPRPNGISKLHLCHKHRLHKERESSQGRVWGHLRW